MKWRNIILSFALVTFLSGCALVDEDMRTCADDYSIQYQLKLVTNMDIELEAQLGMETDAHVHDALKKYLSNIFTDKAHDVDLSFYDVGDDPVRLHHENHIMDANQSSYTLYIPVRKYTHIAVANLANNPDITLEKDDYCTTSAINAPVANILNSHKCGIFTARQPMDIKENIDQQFNVHLWMANCAAALILNTNGKIFKDVKVLASGFASGMNLADSTYNFNYTPYIKAEEVPIEGDGQPLCYTAVSFPSKDVEKSKAIISSSDPFVSEVADEALWFFNVYITLDDDTVTETKLGVRLPLKAGQLKVIKTTVEENGSVVPLAPYVGASVKLDWNDGPEWDVDF